MNIASMGPHVVVPIRDKAKEDFQAQEQPIEVLSIPEDEGATTNEGLSPKKEQLKTSRLLDLIQEAQRKKLVRSKSNRRRARAVAAYRRQMEGIDPQASLGTLLKAER